MAISRHHKPAVLAALSGAAATDTLVNRQWVRVNPVREDFVLERDDEGEVVVQDPGVTGPTRGDQILALRLRGEEDGEDEDYELFNNIQDSSAVDRVADVWHRVTAVARLPAGIRNKEKEERREKRRKERNKQAADDATRAVARAAVKQSQQEAGRQKEQAQAAQAETEAAAAAAAAAKKKPEGATAMSHEAGRRQQTEANAEEAAYANEKRRQLQNLLAILVRIITQREAFLRWKAAAAEDKEKELVFKNVWKVAADMATMQKIMRGVDKMRQKALFDKWKQSKQSNADEPDKNAMRSSSRRSPMPRPRRRPRRRRPRQLRFEKPKQ